MAPRYRFVAIVLMMLSSFLPNVQSAAATSDTPAMRANCALRGLTLRGKVGQVLMVSVEGTGPSQNLREILSSWQPGGIILFSRNVHSASDLRALIRGAQQATSLPLLVATDQEGGSVVRVGVGLTPLRAQAWYGQARSAAQVYADTYAQGLALKDLGINLNLAPVVDVTASSGSAIGSRSFGPDPLLNSVLVTASVLGYQAAGIGATAKHFLALGEVKANADLSLPVVKATRAQIEARDMPPMRAAVESGVDAMMVTRVVIPALDPSGTTAYASPTMIKNIIRGELGFSGLLITDSLLTPAIFAGPGPEVAAVAALTAGDDLLLLGTGVKISTTRIEKVVNAVYQAVVSGTVPMSRLDEAVTHVLELKARLGLLPACLA